MNGRRFKAALDELDMTPEEFAESCGVNRTTVYRWIAGRAGERPIPVPLYASWIVSLLLERRQLSEHLAEPAE
jgi:transcriptional regulator with XRE-family HTH domain